MGNNTAERSDFLNILNLDRNNGKIVKKKYYYPKPSVAWVISREGNNEFFLFAHLLTTFTYFQGTDFEISE